MKWDKDNEIARDSENERDTGTNTESNYNREIVKRREKEGERDANFLIFNLLTEPRNFCCCATLTVDILRLASEWKMEHESIEKNAGSM